MRNILKNRKGEGYIDICIGVIALVMFIVVLINTVGLIIEHENVEAVCDELLDVATSTGAFGDDLYDCADILKGKYGNFEMSTSADSYIDGTDNVQLGKRMTVTIHKKTYLQGFGVIKIPVEITVEKDGLSERYWK